LIDQLASIGSLGLGIQTGGWMHQSSGTHPKGGTAFCYWDEGSYTLSYTHEAISCHVTSPPWQEPEQELSNVILAKVSARDRNVRRL